MQPTALPEQNTRSSMEGVQVNTPIKTRATVQDRLDLSGYNIQKNMLGRKADITFEQLLQLLPSLKQPLGPKRIKQFLFSENKRHDEFNYLAGESEDSVKTTAVRCYLQINNITVDALIDCGASKTIITKRFADKINYTIDAPSTVKFTIGNNSPYQSLGIIYDVPIVINGLIIPLSVEVLLDMPADLIIGTNWLTRAKATVTFDLQELHVRYKQQETKAKIRFVADDENETPIPISSSDLLDHLTPHYEDSDTENDLENGNITPNLLENEIIDDFHCLVTHEDARITYDSTNCCLIVKPGPPLTIPAKSGVPIRLNLPANKLPRLLEISSELDNIMSFSTPILQPNVVKFQSNLENYSDDPITLAPRTILGTFAEVDSVQSISYEINRGESFCTMHESDSSSKPAELTEEQKSLLNIGEVDDSVRSQLYDIVAKFEEIFDWHNDKLGKTTLLSHTIATSDEVPVRSRPYRMSPEELQHLKKELDKYCELGVIKPSSSPWAAPIIMVKKKDNSYRLVVDYRALNAKTIKDSYPLPRIDDLLDTVGNAKVFSALDMRNAFHQIPVNESSQDKTAFVTKFRVYSYTMMPMGLCNSTSTFQRVVDLCFLPLLNKCVVAYLDDQNVFSNDNDQDLKDLTKVFSCLQKAKFVLNPAKCTFFKDKLNFLGHVITKEDVHADPTKIDKIKNFPRPTTVTGIKSFVALASYYRKFCPSFAKIARPLHQLTKKTNIGKNPIWNSEVEEAFQNLKTMLTTPPVLVRPDFSKPFTLITDASRKGLGAVLSQLDDEGKERVILYLSRGLAGAEENYGVSKLECLAVVWAIKKLRPYLLGSKFQVLSDHSALRGLINSKETTGILARWQAILNEYSFEVKYRPGRVNSNADFFSRLGY